MISSYDDYIVAFNKPSFRGRQKEIMEAAVHGADVLVVAPTGMGKRYVISISIAVGWHRKLIHLRSFGVGSLCFQVPAVADAHGITIVISPLLCKLYE